MKSPNEVKKWIHDSAEYLKEKMAWDDEFERRKPREGEALSLRAETKSRLEDCLKQAKTLQESLYPLLMKADDNPFPGMPSQIHRAYESATDSVVACTLALDESLPKPGNRRLQYRYHRSAVKLAAALFAEPNRKETLLAAEKIIQAAGLDDNYTSEAAQKWWLQVKAEFYGDSK